VNHLVWGSAWIEREVGPNQGLLSSSEAAGYLGITLVWLYHLVKEGKLYPKRQKGRLVFRFGELRRYRWGQEARAKAKHSRRSKRRG